MLAGTDPLELDFRRLINLAEHLWLEGMDPELREPNRLILAWPEEKEEHARQERLTARAQQEQEAESQLRQSAAVIGVDLESMYERQVRARQLGLAQIAENQRQAEAKRLRDVEAEVLDTSPREWADQAAAEVEREEEVSGGDHR